MTKWYALLILNLTLGIVFHVLGTLTGPLVFLFLGTLSIGFLFYLRSDLTPEEKGIEVEPLLAPIENTAEHEQQLQGIAQALEAHGKALDFLVSYVQAVQQQQIA